MDANEMVNQYMHRIKPLGKVEVLERIQEAMSEKNKAEEIRTGDVIEAFFRIEEISEDIAKDLVKDGFQVVEYEDVHSPFKMWRIYWGHLVNKKDE